MISRISQFRKMAVVLLCLCLALTAVSQNVDQMVSIPSPNATSLGIYSETPVSLFTGNPQIGIPIYEIKVGDLKLPVSLSYNVAGVRPDVHPGWVGLGWSLNAGGMITRKIKGLPDEYCWHERIWEFDSNPGSFWEPPRYYPYGYNYNYDKLNRTDWSSISHITELAQGEFHELNEYGIGTWKDTEPDEFVFNFNGYTGKFYFNEFGEIEVASNPDIKIEPEDTLMLIGYPDVYVSNYIGNISADLFESEIKIRGFRITTPDGVKYEFGLWNRSQSLSNLPIEASIDFFQEFYMNESWDTWYLVRIESPNSQEKIDFTYELGDPIASFGMTTALNKMSGESQPSGIFRLFGPVSASSYSVTTRYDGRLIYPVYLTRITTRKEEIVFSTSVTTEQKYDYPSILNELYTQSSMTYRTDVLSVYFDNNGYMHDGRWYFSSRYAIRGPIPEDTVTTYPYSSYYDNGLGFFSRQDLDLGYGIYEAEIIDFNSLKWRQLDNIYINDIEDNTIKSIDLEFTSSTSEPLRLLSVQVNDNNDNSLSPYYFEYEDYETNDYPASTLKLPAYNTFSTDHWGFFSGSKSFASLFYDSSAQQWYTNTVLNNYKSKREPVAQYLYAGILTRIHYPTGGYSKYVYEPHQYTKKVTRNTSTGAFSLSTVSATTAGGLRIKELQSYDSNGSLSLKKEFEYDLGILTGDIQYYWPGYIGKLTTGATYTADRFVSNTILPVSSNSTGSHVGYSKVTEKMTDNGKTVYYFQNFQDHPDIGGTTHLDDNFVASIDPLKSPYSPFSDREIERGQTKEVDIYSEDESSFTIIRKEVNTFTQNPLRANEFLPAVATTQIPVLGGVAIDGTAYKVFTYPYNLTSKTAIVYDHNGQNPVTTYEDYSYNAVNLLSTRTNYESDNSWTRTEYRYPKDVDNYVGPQPTNPVARAILTMARPLGNNMLSYPIEIIKYKNGLVTGATINTYSEFPAGSKNINLYQNYELEVPGPISNYIKSGFSTNPALPLSFDSRFKLRRVYDNYDTLGNLLQYHNENDVNNAFIVGYNGSFTTASTQNASYNEIYFESFEDEKWLRDASNPDKPARYLHDWHNGRYSLYVKNGQFGISQTVDGLSQDRGYILSAWIKTEDGFDASNGNQANLIIQVIDKSNGQQLAWLTTWVTQTNGVWKRFERDVDLANFSQNVKLKIELWNSNNSKYLLADDIRFVPKDAKMTSYTYHPILGLTSVTDPNNISQFFEYDLFGRLKNVRDNDGKITSRTYYHYYNDPSSDTPYLNTSPASLSFGSNASSSTFTISSNCSWTIADNASWLTTNTASGSGNATITVSATSNTNIVRNATITVTYAGGLTKILAVSQAAAFLNLSPTTIFLTSIASSGTFVITSNCTWSITDNASWLSVSTTSGTGNATITANATTNIGAARNATITITYSGGLTKTVTVSQAAGSSSTLTVNYQAIYFGPIAPPKLVTVTSNTSWTVTKSASWITLSTTSGTGNGTVGIGATKLNVGSRTGTVTFKTSDNTVTRMIEIQQDGLIIE